MFKQLFTESKDKYVYFLDRLKKEGDFQFGGSADHSKGYTYITSENVVMFGEIMNVKTRALEKAMDNAYNNYPVPPSIDLTLAASERHGYDIESISDNELKNLYHEIDISELEPGEDEEDYILYKIEQMTEDIINEAAKVMTQISKKVKKMSIEDIDNIKL